MASRGVFWGAVAGSLLVGGVAGFAAGWYGGFEMTSTHYGNEWLYEQARDVESRISVLRALRSGQRGVAADRLEAELDDDLVGIRPDPRIGRRTVDEINKAIAEVRAYRSEYPYTASRPQIGRMVEEVLSGAPYTAGSK